MVIPVWEKTSCNFNSDNVRITYIWYVLHSDFMCFFDTFLSKLIKIQLLCNVNELILILFSFTARIKDFLCSTICNSTINIREICTNHFLRTCKELDYWNYHFRHLKSCGIPSTNTYEFSCLLSRDRHTLHYSFKLSAFCKKGIWTVSNTRRNYCLLLDKSESLNELRTKRVMWCCI